jgi:hypothetical protein
MDGINIGTVSASVTLDTGPFIKSMQLMNAAIIQMGSSISNMVSQCSNAQAGLQGVGQSASGIIAPLGNVGAVANTASAGLSSLAKECASLAGIAGSTSGVFNQMANSVSGISSTSSGSASSLVQFVGMLSKMSDTIDKVASVVNLLLSSLLRLSNQSLTVANGAEGIAASLGRIPPQALEIVGVIILVTAAMYGLYRFFKPDDGAIMWRRMCDSAMQCKASVEPFIRDMISAVSHLAGTVKNVLGKAWEENRGWILMLADAWVRVGMAEWTVIIKAVSIAFTGVAKAVDWLIGKLGKAINLMKYMPQFSMLKAVGDAYWKNSGGLPSGQVGGLSTAGVKTPSKKPGGKNENAAIFARVQEGESGRNHKTSTPRYTSHTGTGGIPTNTYRVPSVTTPSYKTPPPTVDEKADKVIGNLSNARELLDSGAQNLSKWMKGLSVEEHIRRLTQIANGEGQWAKVSIEIRKRAADQIQQLRDRQAQEEEKAIQNHIRLLGEEYAQGKISNEKYIEELKKIAAQKETYQNAGIETARAAAAKIEEIERQNMENRLIIARSLGNEEEVIEIERQQRMEALTKGGMKKEDAETVAKSEADSKLENIFTAKQSQEMEQKDWDKAHGKVSQDEYITFLKTKRNESEQWAKDHGQDSKNNRNYRTVTGKLEDAYNEQARGKIDAAIEENGKNTEALKQALLLLKEEYSALGDAGIKAFDTVNAKIKEFNTGIVESTTTLDNAQDKTASWANVQENAFDGMLTNIGSGLSNAIVDWMQGINSFGDFMKNLWKQVLNTIVNSIVQQVLSSNKYLKGLFSGASGGKGGFLSGLLGSIPGIGGILGGIAGIFGFDSPTNDTTASRYGADFARIFRQGAEDELGRALAPSAQASPSSPVVHNNNQQVTVSTSVDRVTGITDIERISETQAWIIGQRLGLAPTTG